MKFKPWTTKTTLGVFGVLFVLIALPLTVFLVNTAEQQFKATRASTTFDTECAGNLDPQGKSQCGANRTFCDTWTGGFCDDFRDLHTTTGVAWPGPEDVANYDFYSQDATNPEGKVEHPLIEGGLLAHSKYEHFMTFVDSGDFGMGSIRLKQPFDFTNREGHIHFEVDWKNEAREYIRVMISPQLTKRLVDDRGASNAYPNEGVDMWFNGGAVNLNQMVNGVVNNIAFDHVGIDSNYDNVREPADIYISKNRVRVVWRGEERFNRTMPNLNWEKGYVYFAQVSYNPCKDGLPCTTDPTNPNNAICNPSACLFHWDNLAFDGPKLAINGLTPASQQDVVFMAYGYSTCSVKGIPATPTGKVQGYTWNSWVARMPVQTVTESNISCTNDLGGAGLSSDPIKAFEVVAQSGGGGGGETTPPTVSLTAPANGSTVSGNVTLSANASDASGISTVEFYVDNNVKGSDSTSPYSITWDSSSVSNGSHQVKAIAYDTLGNSAPSTVITVSSNNVIPPVTLTVSGSPGTGSYNIEATTTIAGDIRVEFSVDGTAYHTENEAPYWLFGDGNNSTLGNGTHTIVANVYDQNGSTILATGTKTITEGSGGGSKLGDLNGDNQVNSLDLTIVISKWGTNDASADLNKNGKVDSGDLALIIANWGR